MFPWELRSIDCSERTEITTLFVIGKGKEGRRGRRIRNVTFFSHLPKSFIFWEELPKESRSRHNFFVTSVENLDMSTMTWNSAKPYENRRDVNMKTWKKMKKFSLQAAFETFLLLDVLWKAGVESWSTTFKMGSFFDEKLKSSPSFFGQVWRLSTSQWLHKVAKPSKNEEY